MPAVAQDSFGQIHVRGDHANVQFRINGVELPEGLSVFGQALETRFARSVSLTGALPAQYGFFTAGVLDIQTKTGLTNPGLALTMYGGSFNWLEPSFEYGGHEGPVDWFFTGDHLSNERGIENPAPTYNAIHDATQQIHGFSYMSGIIDPNTRVNLLAPTRARGVWTVRTLRISRRTGSSGGLANWRLRSGRRLTGRFRRTFSNSE
jgi:hypothetical protein